MLAVSLLRPPLFPSLASSNSATMSPLRGYYSLSRTWREHRYIIYSIRSFLSKSSISRPVMSSQTVILTFKDKTSYQKYKKEVLDNGGTIKNDLGETLLGFTATISPTVVALLQSSSLQGDSGITSFEPDNQATIQ